MSTDEFKELISDIEKEIGVTSLDKDQKTIVVKTMELYHKRLVAKSESSFLALNHQVKEGSL